MPISDMCFVIFFAFFEFKDFRDLNFTTYCLKKKVIRAVCRAICGDHDSILVGYGNYGQHGPIEYIRGSARGPMIGR